MNAAPLPAPLGIIEIPRTFTVTAVCTATACKLRIVAASDLRLDRLGSGPKASMGSLYHALIYEWALSGDTDPVSFFDTLTAAWDEELRQNPRTAHQAPLRATMNAVDWISFRRKALAAMARARIPTVATAAPAAGDSAAVLAASTGAGGGCSFAGRSLSTQREKMFESETLRLRGKPDLVRRRSPKDIEIRDFKSGVIWQGDGRLKESIVLQMYAYGLLIDERERGAEIELVVDDGEGVAVPFDRENRVRVRNMFAGLLSGLEAGKRVNAEELASPGADCGTCAIRHLCPAYRAAAPLWWRTFPKASERIPHDTWGSITGVETSSSGVRIRLADAAGRSVQIDNLDARHGFGTDDVGRYVWFFGLTVRGYGRSPDGIRFQPHNFFELPRDGGDRRAWTVEVYS